MEYLHENQYFTCTCGLKPAKMSSTQNIMLYEKKYYYLTRQSTASSHIGDFACRWTVVLAGLVIGLGVVTGGAALLVFGAAVLASGLMCGALFAGARKWIVPKNTVSILQIELLTERAIMTCPVGGEVTVAPGIDCWWKAVIYSGRNLGYAFLEGWFLGKMAGGGGKALFGAKNVATAGQFAKNFLFLQGTARITAAADQVLFEGMLRNGLSFEDAVKENAVGGLTAFEQPFINIYKKLNGEVEYPDGTKKPLNWTDFYGAGMSAFGTTCMAKASLAHPNIPQATWNKIKDSANKLKGKLKGKAYEMTPSKSIPSFDDFKKTVDGGFPSDNLAQQAYDLFTKGDWPALEKLFKDNNLNGGWPPNRGASKSIETTLKPGDKIDRYGGWYDEQGNFQDKGTFAGKDGTPYSERALPKGSNDKPYNQYEVVKEIPGVIEGDVIPWFEEAGGGVQYELPANIGDLIDGGYIKKI